MDFITELPKTVKQHDSIMVIVDKLKKVTHFILVMSTFSASYLAQVFSKMWLDYMVFRRRLC